MALNPARSSSMKPSRALYVATGATLALAFTLPIPGTGIAVLMLSIATAAAALTFDWNNA
jgi:putative effector of murein hydrolase LrgA (UPF0299 family)